MPYKLLENKTAIVTGSTRGIGRAIALLLAEHGASVIINGRNEEMVDKTVKYFLDKGLKVYGLAGDVSKEEFANNLSTLIREKFGSIDILINNAGSTEWRLLDDLTLELWDKDLNNNLRSAFLICKKIAPIMKTKKCGKIINIASISGIRSRIGGAHYIAAKSGLIGFTKALALELGSFNIKVNAIAPGLIDTYSSRRIYSQSVFDKIANETALKRIGSPLDVAGVALFFASPLSDFVTGQTLIVDGGMFII